MYTHCQHTASTILFICATVIDICRDVVSYLVTFVVYLRTHLPRRHCKHTCLAGNANTPAWQALQPSIDADTGTAAVLLLQIGNVYWVVQLEHGCNKSKNTTGCLLIWLKSQARIARCGDCYDHQLVNRRRGDG